MSVIECNHVSIRYITGDFKAIGMKEYITRKLTGNYHVTEFWADKDVTFTLEKGDMLGIVGTNGAGKSTLLKAITGIMVPTGGTVGVHGSVAALLELGSGFDNELTVRENTYLRGALLGYTRKFMDEKYNEIIEFAELEDFQEYMFKQLSSGMKSRLAFAIASLVDPDILILDEVLSVGDGAFKEKSAQRMRDILQNGVTGILVSHSVDQVRDMCNKVLWLDHGQQIAFGEMEPVCNAYQDFLSTPKSRQKLPESMDEIIEISNCYKVAMELNRREGDDLIEKRQQGIILPEMERRERESFSAREQRFMRTARALPAEEYKTILSECVNMDLQASTE